MELLKVPDVSARGNYSPTTPGTVYTDPDATDMTLPIDMRFNEGHIVSITTYSVLMVISAVGNITVLVILLRRRRKVRSRINNMLMHLSIADLLVTFLMMPLEIGWAATVRWLAGDALCRIMAFFRIFGLYLSSFVLVCISVDRYFAVLRPMQISDRRGKLMLTGAWVAATICSMPQMVVFHVDRHPTFQWYEQCITFNTLTDTYALIYALVGMVATYCLPLVVIIFSYASILLEIFRRSRDPIDDKLRRSSLGFLGRAKIRTLKMTIIIVLVFFVCWTPYYVMCVWYWVDKASASEVDQRVQKGLFLFASTNSCMNPIVYGAFNIRSRRGGSQRQRQTESRLAALGVLRLVSWRREEDVPLESTLEPGLALSLGNGNGLGARLPSGGSSSEHADPEPMDSQASLPEVAPVRKGILRMARGSRASKSAKGCRQAAVCSSCGESLARASGRSRSASRPTQPVPDVTAVAVARERGEFSAVR